MRKLLLSVVALLLATPLAGAEPAHRSYTEPKALVAALQDQLKTINDYSMTVYTEDTHHEWVFDYKCVRPSNIRAEILQGSHHGTVVVYVPAVKDKMVKIKAGNKRVWRSIEKLKLKDTPMTQSVLDKFSADLNDYTFTMKTHQKVVVDVGRTVKDKPAGGSDPVLGNDPELDSASPAPASTGGPAPQRVEKDCYILDGTKGDTREVMAFDSTTLWPVSVTIWKNGKPDATAQIWQMSINTTPKIDF